MNRRNLLKLFSISPFSGFISLDELKSDHPDIFNDKWGLPENISPGSLTSGVYKTTMDLMSREGYHFWTTGEIKVTLFDETFGFVPEHTNIKQISGLTNHTLDLVNRYVIDGLFGASNPTYCGVEGSFAGALVHKADAPLASVALTSPKWASFADITIQWEDKGVFSISYE
jgi:hypothetical protein